MSITLSALQQQRRDTAANWTSANPTLLAGEIGVETDTGLLKIGDGSTAWTSLDYLPLSFEGYAANGIYNPAANQVALATNGTGRLFIDSSGNIGVGTSSTGTKLHVAGSGQQILRIQDTGNTNGFDLGNNTTESFVSTSDNKPITFYTNNLERAKIDSSGRLLVGTSSSNSSFNSGCQIAGTGLGGTQLINRFDASVGGPILYFAKSRNATVGSNTIVQSGDILGSLEFYGANGTGYNAGAQIRAFVDGAPGAINDMPGRLVFSTSADNSSSPTERMRIDSSGNVKITSEHLRFNTSGKGIIFGAEGGSNRPSIIGNYTSPSDNNLVFNVTTSERMRIDSSGNVGIGTPSPGALLDVAGSNGKLLIANGTTSDSMRLSAQNATGTGNAALVFESWNLEYGRFDTSGRLGIGTSSPAQRLVVNNNSDNSDVAVFTGGDVNRGLKISTAINGLNDSTVVFNAQTTSTGQFTFETAGTERMRIDKDGNVGIGTSSPGGNLTVTDASTYTLDFKANGSDGALITTLGGSASFALGTDNTERMRIDSSGRLGIGTSSPARQFVIHDSTVPIIQLTNDTTGTTVNDGVMLYESGSNFIVENQEDGYIRIITGGAERARILSSGGLTFNGDTAQANALDDYEEGTWTPEYGGETTGGTYTYGARSGIYTKIGNLVIASFSLVNISTSSAGSGTALITGLPFTSTSTFSYNSTVPRFDNFNLGSATYVTCLVDNNSTRLKFFTVTTNASDNVLDVTAKNSNTSDVFGTVVYLT